MPSCGKILGMDISVYARHLKSCAHLGDRHWRRCKCPKWLYHSATRKRESAQTRSWERAETLAKRLSDEIAAGKATSHQMTVEEAVERYLQDKREQKCGDALLSKLTRLLLRPSPRLEEKSATGKIPEPRVKVLGFVEWCATKPTPAIKDAPMPVNEIASISLRHLEEFRRTWPGSPITMQKKQELLRAFFGYCMIHGWTKTNPAKLLSRIKVDQEPTDYFTDEEFAKIISACDTYRPIAKDLAPRREKVKALALLLRWSGLRAGDAIKLERAKLDGNKLLLRMEKTGTPVWCPIPPDVADQLRSVENSNPAYFFWSGNGTGKSIYGDWWRTFVSVFKEADLGKRCHIHRFRDTFAVGLLLAGVPIEQVSKLLGHKSIRVTEKHYSPWVAARQEQLEASVQKAWAAGK
jgi:integrase/recombinase XerD